MHRHRRPYSAAVAAVLLAALLGACGSPDSGAVAGSGPSATASAGTGTPVVKAVPPVTGALDDHRHVARRTAPARRPHMVQRCTDRTRRVKHTSSKGSGKRKSTRTWYTTEHYQDCRKVQQGTESYTRVVSAERWCVELDDVGGDRTRDDVWYKVDATTYGTAVGAEEGTPMSFTPLASGC
ncbi:hypothetical protein PV350_30205 [Streptomyces sp. PA03-6a]|nr:hypothetical protein [Streptomyces sp. PA03-6a]